MQVELSSPSISRPQAAPFDILLGSDLQLEVALLVPARPPAKAPATDAALPDGEGADDNLFVAFFASGRRARFRSHAHEGRVGWYNAKLLPTVLPNWSIATLGSEVLHADWVEAVTAL